MLPLVDGPLAAMLVDVATGRLRAGRVSENSDKLAGVVLAARNYPGRPEIGHEIRGLDAAEAVEGALVFHAGTREVDGRFLTAGGRVLTIVGRAHSYERAIEAAYESVARIQFDGMQFRRDIGQKAIAAAARAAR